MNIEQRKWSKDSGWELISSSNLQETAGLVFLFGELELLKDQERLREIKDLYPNAGIIGCSTAGEIIGTLLFDDSLVATAVSFAGTDLQFVQAIADKMDDSFLAGKELADRLGKENLRHVFVLSGGLRINGSELVSGLISGLPEGVAVTGGLAGDQSRFKETLTFLQPNGLAAGNIVTGVGFYGSKIRIGYGSMGGWDSFGSDRLVTRSTRNTLYELDGAPVLDLYKKYLGEQAQGLPATGLFFPLSLHLPGRDANLVRTMLSVNEQDKSIIFAGDIPEGSYVRLMMANSERLLDGATEAAKMSRQLNETSLSDLAILISCVGRKLVLNQRVEEELECVKQVLGDSTTMAGFYSYGEICPVSSSEKQSELHNQTMTITVFSELG